MLSESQAATKVSKELRRSNRAKFARISLVLSGGNSKTYLPSTAISISRSEEVAKSSLKDVTEGHTEFGKQVEKLAHHESNPLKNTQANGDQKSVPHESSKDDCALFLPDSQQPSMMTTRLKRSKSPSTTALMIVPKRAKGDLDEPTMIAFKNFLNMHKFDSLDEDEVIGDTLAILKAANEKTRTILSEMRSDAYGKDDESVFEKCLQVEENHAIGQDFLREIVTGIGQTPSGPAKKSNSSAVFKVNTNKVLVDQKTVGWIRRATGLHRNTSNAELTHTYSTIRQESKSESSSRISTRRLVNDGNVSKKKRNRGLDVMTDAIAELEKDFGTHFPVYRFRSSPPKKKRARHSLDVSTTVHKMTGDKQRPARKKTRRHKEKKPSPRICTALRVLDETWRLQTKPNKFIGQVTETEIELYLRRLSIPLHPEFMKAGIIHRLPSINSVIRTYSRSVMQNSFAPLQNPSLNDDDSMMDKLTCLEGPPAQFAKFEFFYSDLDKEWYDLFGYCLLSGSALRR